MNSVQIRFAPDILRRLGEELNPSLDQGILELVKNAYDADAKVCKVELIETDEIGGSIRISDDGNGMDVKGIANGWLILGRSDKSTKQRTQLGRIPAGSKGLGRLAALRMGSAVTLITRPKTDDISEYKLRINWADYERVEFVDDVALIVESSARRSGSKSGSEIILENLNSHINRMDVKRLARALILLADPFGDDPSGFEPVLIAPEYSDLERLVQNRYFNDADFHLIARVDETGRAQASVIDWKGKVLFSADHNELTASREYKPYSCPPATFDLWAFLLTRTAFTTRSASLDEVRVWLQTFGGVHLYENGLRVAPYGNPGNDWLDMNLRRAQSPEERPSTNNSIGRVTVFNDDALLIQKTDRSGFIEGESFIELRSFAQNALDWMARRRLEIAQQRRDKGRAEEVQKSQKSKKKIEEVIEKVPKGSQRALKEAFSAYERSKEREVKELRKEVQLYRTLSTAGITAATFAHESSGNPIKVITHSVKAVERRAKKELGNRYEDILKKPVESIIKAVDALAVLGTATLNLVNHEKRRVGRVEVHNVIQGILDTFKPFLAGRDVDVKLELYPGNPYLRGSEAAVESIITNLINNSLTAFERSDGAKRQMLISTDIRDDMLTLRVLDNGPGIEGISLKDIWLPGETTQPNGTGLGLAIVRDAVKDLGGEVEAAAHGKLGGAEIIIKLPVLGG